MMKQGFTEYSGLDLSAINKQILEKWNTNNTFKQSIDLRAEAPTFVFYEGPPSANGMPGIHHVMARAIKDIFCRFKTMQGFRVERKAGWDTHGLPVELGVEKSLGITKEDIGKKISVEQYNAACRKDVMKFTREWEELTRRMGYWVDMSHPYITYDNKYIETLWYLLKELYNKNLLYKGYTIQPYSPAAGTGLSSHELNQPGCYRDVKDLTCVAMFKLKSPLNPPQGDSEKECAKIYNTANPVNYEVLKENAKNRRKNPTEAENFLWQNLQNKQLGEYKFRREHIIGDCIADFVCLSKQLIIEVDGGYHNEENQKELDQARTEYLKQKGFKVIRFTNEDVLFNIEKTLETIKDALSQVPLEGDLGCCYFLAWTTTPWTLPSNTALCVGENILYTIVKTKNPYTNEPCCVILAKDRLSAFFGEKKIEDYEIAGEKLGKDLVGVEYEQLLPFVAPLNPSSRGDFEEVQNSSEVHKICNTIKSALHQSPPEGDLGGCSAFRVISGDFVTTEDGTGIVHIAPTFGADDDRVAKQNGIVPMLLLDKTGKQVPMVDLTGKFYKIEDLDENFVKTNVNVELYKNFAGKFVKDAYYQEFAENHLSLDTEICLWLQQSGLLFKKEKHTHNYPHCWRTDKPVLYYPLDSWFIKSTACREQMIALNNTINWKPQSTGTGRFGKWLENLNDWNLSRSRYWGTPLPIWRTEDGGEEMCIGSIEELMTEIEKSVTAGVMTENPFKNFTIGDFSEENYSVKNIDLHRPYVDNIILVSPSGKPMKRELDLIDVWFDSGAMPYAQVHYPFENKEIIDNGSVFPADFISEGVDQTRGWFFTLHAISTMIKGSVAFKNVISNGLVLDKNGNKMSKRLGNAVDPFETIEKYGSDPLRWYMITNASPWENLKYDNEGIEELKRKFFGTLYNTYSFFALYANLDNFDPTVPQVPFDQRPELDRWILSLLNTLIQEVTAHYENYDPTKAGRAIQDFVMDNVSNWFVRLSRKRFWKGELHTDKLSAYQTLHACLKTVAQLMAPIAPFYAEQLYSDVTKTDVSVHLEHFPKANTALIDSKLETQMHTAQIISSMVLALRRKVAIKVRQPLQKIIIPIVNEEFAADVQKIADIVKSEVNVKEIELLSDASGILVKKVKANFKSLGPRYGKIMKQIAAHLSEMENATIFAFEKSGSYSFDIEGTPVEITLADVEIISEDIPGWQVANEGAITVAIDTTITPELLHEGIAREFVNRIQNLRKESGLDVTDTIDLYIQKHDFVNQAVEKYKNYMASETLCTSVTLAEQVTVENKKMIEIEEIELEIGIQKTNRL